MDVDQDRKDLKFTKLVRTSDASGLLEADDARNSLRNNASAMELRMKQGQMTGKQCMALLTKARARLVPTKPVRETRRKATRRKATTKTHRAINRFGQCTLPTLDCMLSFFLNVRARPQQIEDIRFRFQKSDLCAEHCGRTGWRNRLSSHSSP